jgi:hypothetical protein
VPAAAVGNDPGQNAPHIGVETVPGGQARGVLALEGIRQIQALALLVGIQHHHADVGSAVDIGQAQDLPFAQNQRGVRPAG